MNQNGRCPLSAIRRCRGTAGRALASEGKNSATRDLALHPLALADLSPCLLYN